MELFPNVYLFSKLEIIDLICASDLPLDIFQIKEILKLTIAILQQTHLLQSSRPKGLRISQEGFEECITRNICDILKLKIHSLNIKNI